MAHLASDKVRPNYTGGILASLFRYEANNLTPENTIDRERSLSPLLAALKRSMHASITQFSKKSDFFGPKFYALSRWRAPTFTLHRDAKTIESDNDAAERSKGAVAFSFKSYLLVGYRSPSLLDRCRYTGATHSAWSTSAILLAPNKKTRILSHFTSNIQAMP
jgi:hypothetical protein